MAAHPAADTRRQADPIITGANPPMAHGGTRLDATDTALPSLQQKPPPPHPSSTSRTPYHAEEATSALRDMNINAASAGPGWAPPDMNSTIGTAPREDGVFGMYMQDASSNQTPPSPMNRVASVRRPLPPTPGSTSTFPSDSIQTAQTSLGSSISSLPTSISHTSHGVQGVQQSNWEQSALSYSGKDELQHAFSTAQLQMSSGWLHHEESSSAEISLLSTVAVATRRQVPRAQHHRGSESRYGFTGRDLVNTLEMLIEGAGRFHLQPEDVAESSQAQRKLALQIADSLQAQLWIWPVFSFGESQRVSDDPDQVYTFMDDGSGEQSNGDNVDPDIIPTGVITPLTLCYSPLCAQDGADSLFGCYSPHCPRAAPSPLRHSISANTETRSGSATQGSGVSGSHAVDPPETRKLAWAETVDPSILQTLSKREIARQNEIHEAIQKEEDFYEDLSLLDTLFIPALERPNAQGDPPPLPLGDERDLFIAEVFANYRQLIDQVGRFLERLHQRQREEFPVIQNIGDIFLDAALDWGDAFIRYIVNYPLARTRVRREMSVNPRFAAFVETARRDPRCHRLTLDHFLYRPSPRLQRYRLHLQEIRKYTDETNYDRDSITQAMDVINDQLQTCNAGMVAAELKAKIRDYSYTFDSLRLRGAPDLELLSPERQLVHEGRVYRKPDGFDFDWQDCMGILFDHYLVIAKGRKGDDQELWSAIPGRSALARRPIPLELLDIVSFEEPPVSRSAGLGSFNLRNADRAEVKEAWPFVVKQCGSAEVITLFVTSAAQREEWRSKLESAVKSRLALQEINRIFEIQPLSAEIFALPSTSSLDPDRIPPGADASLFHGRITCAVPFSTADGRRLLAVGCADGVWIGLRHDPRSLRKVLHLKLVTQCAVLESFGIFVVLADKVLISYSLEALVPSATAGGAPPRPPQRLSGNRDVLFFNVGVLKERTLLIYMKKKASESVFRALEPVVNTSRSQEGRSGSSFFGKFGKDNKTSDWFRVYKTFFIPSESYSLQYLRSKLCVVCAKGFEIMNLDSLLPGTIPDFSQCPRDDLQVQMLMKRIEVAKALGMFKISESEFLLCYDTFACYVDRLGNPVRLLNCFNWEGHPRSVAYSAPWVLAFDARFIEVRDGFTGALVQVLRGSDIRNVSGGSIIASTESQEIMVTQRCQGPSPSFDVQIVYELTRRHVPTMYGAYI